MENRHFLWENPLFLWPCSIAMLVHQRVDNQQDWENTWISYGILTWIYNQQSDVGCVWTCCTHQHGQSIQLTWWWTNPDKHGMEWGSRWHQSVMQHPQCTTSWSFGLLQISHLLQSVLGCHEHRIAGGLSMPCNSKPCWGSMPLCRHSPLEFHGIPPWIPFPMTASCKASDIVGSTKEVGNVTFLQSKYLRIFLWILSKFEYVDVCIYYNIYVYIYIYIYLSICLFV